MLVVVAKWHHPAILLTYSYSYSFFLDNSVQRGKGAMRLTLCEAPTHKTRPDHYTGNSVPYSLQQVCGFFNFLVAHYITFEDAGDVAYDLLSLSEKTGTSYHCRCHCKGSMFSWVLVWSGAWTRDLPQGSPVLYQLSLPAGSVSYWISLRGKSVYIGSFWEEWP